MKENREIILNLRELETLRHSIGDQHRQLFDMYAESCGFENLANYETHCAYRYLRNYPRAFHWNKEAEDVNRKIIFKDVGMQMSAYEAARLGFAETLKDWLKERTDSYTFDPLTKTLIHGAVDRICWEELSETLLDYARQPKRTRKSPSRIISNVIPFAPGTSSNLIRRRHSRP